MKLISYILELLINSCFGATQLDSINFFYFFALEWNTIVLICKVDYIYFYLKKNLMEQK